MEDPRKDPEYEICLCRHIKRAEVKKLIKEQNIYDLKTLCKKGRVGDKCGGCREDLQQLLDDIRP